MEEATLGGKKINFLTFSKHSQENGEKLRKKLGMRTNERSCF